MGENTFVKNPFGASDEPSRYSQFRPVYHHIPFHLILDFVGQKFERALDVACGTGHSTEELLKISNTVIGCDLSDAMLAEARKRSECEFICAPGESLPFDKDSFDLVNTSMGFHWLDQDRFLAECQRVLKGGGYLSIDSFGFLGQISSDSIKQDLHSHFMATYLPMASRRASYPSPELANRYSFDLRKEFKYETTIEMSAQEFVNLLTTWSNFQILEEQTKQSTLDKMNILYETIFGGGRLPLQFGGRALLFQKK